MPQSCNANHSIVFILMRLLHMQNSQKKGRFLPFSPIFGTAPTQIVGPLLRRRRLVGSPNLTEVARLQMHQNMSLGDIHNMPTRSKFVFFQGFLNFLSKAPKFHS